MSSDSCYTSYCLTYKRKRKSQNFFHREDQPTSCWYHLNIRADLFPFLHSIFRNDLISFQHFFFGNTYHKIYMTPLATPHYTEYCVAPPCLKELLQLWCKCFNNSCYNNLKRQLEAIFLLFANKTAFIYKDIKRSTLKCIKGLSNDHNNRNGDSGAICSVHFV